MIVFLIVPEHRESKLIPWLLPVPTMITPSTVMEEHLLKVRPWNDEFTKVFFDELVADTVLR